MGEYTKAIWKLRQKEGIYDNDPDDAGGETVWGITRRDHPKDPVWAIVDQNKDRAGFPACLADLKALDDAVMAHYKPNYWDKVRGDELAQAVAEEMFDTAVNCGVGIAIKCLEDALNVGNRGGQDYPDAPEDGVFDEADLLRLKLLIGKRGEAAVVKVLNGLQFKRYYELCKVNPKLEKFFWGWALNRA